MRLVTPANRGEWFLWSQDPQTGEKAEFQIRRIPAEVERQIDLEFNGYKRKAQFRKGAQIVEYTAEQAEEINARKAEYALLDSRGAELPMEDVPALAPPVPDVFVKLDGKWTPEVKRQVFKAYPAIAVWIVKKADAMGAQALEDEEGKGETSSRGSSSAPRQESAI